MACEPPLFTAFLNWTSKLERVHELDDGQVAHLICVRLQ